MNRQTIFLFLAASASGVLIAGAFVAYRSPLMQIYLADWMFC